MRQFFGVLVVCFSFFLLFLLAKNIVQEVKAIEQHKKVITQSVHIPSIQNDHPITLLDRNGEVFSEEYIEWRQPLALNKMPTIAKELFLLSEDEHFYSHIGFDVSAIARAIVSNSNANAVQQGGSTITQQLVRMRYLSEEKTYERKLMELFYAYELEQEYSKDEILEMYLNEAYFGNQVYGLGSAATYYFSRPIHELTTAELAFIAAIPNNPTLYNPLKNFENTKARQERLLDILAENNVITAVETKQLKNEPITLQVKKKVQLFPSYSSYVMLELRDLIATQEGLISTNQKNQAEIKKQIDIRIEQLMQSGASIYTALDTNKQAKDEKALNTILSNYDFQGSATVIDNATREIVSIYAGKDYVKYDFHRAYQQPRQPGSTFKPIAAYAPFINETGYNANYKVSGAAYCVNNYCPSNYGGGIYGSVTLSTAFKYSYNTSALRLAHRIGIEKSLYYINQFNFKKITDADYNYAAILGGLSYGVTTSELANAYTSFIDGSYKQAYTIRKVVDKNGDTLYSWPTETKQVWNSKTVTTMRSLLADVVESGTGKGLYSNSSYLGAKTGTTNDYRDLWLAGLSNDYTTAVWIGYDQGQSLEQYENDKIHFKLFNAIMNLY
jgi:penicillin-binding protein 4